MYHLFACLSQMIQCECFEGEEQYCHALCHNAQNQNLLPLHIGWFNDVHTILWYNKIQYDAVQHAYISLKPPELNVFNNWIYQKKKLFTPPETGEKHPCFASAPVQAGRRLGSGEYSPGNQLPHWDLATQALVIVGWWILKNGHCSHCSPSQKAILKWVEKYVVKLKNHHSFFLFFLFLVAWHLYPKTGRHKPEPKGEGNDVPSGSP